MTDRMTDLEAIARAKDEVVKAARRVRGSRVSQGKWPHIDRVPAELIDNLAAALSTLDELTKEHQP